MMDRRRFLLTSLAGAPAGPRRRGLHRRRWLRGRRESASPPANAPAARVIAIDAKGLVGGADVDIEMVFGDVDTLLRVILRRHHEVDGSGRNGVNLDHLAPLLGEIANEAPVGLPRRPTGASGPR
jgi:hypothetical protein